MTTHLNANNKRQQRGTYCSRNEWTEVQEQIPCAGESRT